MITSKGAQTSARLVESMLALIQERGYSGAGMTTVVEHAGAPKGSLYFHFPGGKEELGEKAVARARDQFMSILADPELRSASPGTVFHRVVTDLADLLENSDFGVGCPVSVVTLEMGAHNERLRNACAGTFETWITAMCELLVSSGHSVAAARTLATIAVCGVEGAVIVARATRDVGPLRDAAELFPALLDQPGHLYSEGPA